MPSIAELNKKREAIEKERQKIAERAAERAAKEHEARLEAESKALDWELEQTKAAEKMHAEARKQGARTTSEVNDEEIRRLVEAAKAKAAGGAVPAPKASGSGGTPTTAQKNEEK